MGKLVEKTKTRLSFSTGQPDFSKLIRLISPVDFMLFTMLVLPKKPTEAGIQHGGVFGADVGLKDTEVTGDDAGGGEENQEAIRGSCSSLCLPLQ